jgi:hypothetical protein
MQEDPLDPELEPELEHRLDAWAASQPGNVQPELERRLQAALAGSLTPVRALPSPRVLALAFFAVFVFLGALPVAILKIAHVHLMTDSPSAWMIAIFAGASLLFCQDIARRMIPGSPVRLPLLPVLALSAVAAIAGLALLFPWGEAGAVASEGWRCAALEAIIALPTACVFWLLARRGVLFLSSGLGAALAGVAVFLALAPVQLQCMFPQAPHLLIWHVAPAAILIACGAIFANWQGKL